MDKENRQRQIERYLRGELSTEERKSFEEAMAEDEALAEEVALQALIQDELSDAPKQAFLKELDTLSDEFFSHSGASEQDVDSKPQKKRGGWKYGLGIVLLVLLAFLAWQLFQPAPLPPEEGTAAPPPAPEQETAPEERVAPPPMESTPEVPPVEEESAEESPAPPIAAADPADFTPHPYLHDLLDRQLRSGDPFIEARANLSASDTLTIEGDITTAEMPAEEEFLVFLYSNQGEDYLNGNYLRREPLELESFAEYENASGEKSYRHLFTEQFNIDLDPGWYYYFIARTEEEEPLFVGRIVKE